MVLITGSMHMTSLPSLKQISIRTNCIRMVGMHFISIWNMEGDFHHSSVKLRGGSLCLKKCVLNYKFYLWIIGAGLLKL